MTGRGPPPEVIALARLPDEDKFRVIKHLTAPQMRTLKEEWEWWAHEGQLDPEGDWQVWTMVAGRGFGKTRAGAEWISRMAREDGSLRIALVGATVEDVRKVMIEGQSGLLAVAGADEAVTWLPSAGKLVFASGAEAFVYSGADPDKLRGPEHHIAWCDEISKWRYPDAVWDNLQLTLRLGERPRTLVTTTPRPIGLLKRLTGGGAVTRGRTADNLNLPPAWVNAMAEAYGGTRLGRQELEGELIEDVEGALWTRGLIERCRVFLPELASGRGTMRSMVEGPLRQASGLPPPRGELGEEFWRRVVIGVDPPASAGGDACGIVAVGLGRDGVGYVLGDHSVRGRSPEGWARAVAAAAEAHGADRVIAEKNMGGNMVESVLRGADVTVPVRPVHAGTSKAARAEPVAALFEAGKAKFAGAFPALEDELAGMQAGGGYEGPGRSPDRADAMIWAMSELMLGKAARVPRVTVL